MQSVAADCYNTAYANAGFVLNNQMDDFSTPDQANVYGLAPSAPNFIRPGKKPLSSMSPTLVQDPQGRLVAALGASGGPRIITAVLQTLIRYSKASCARICSPLQQ